MPKAGRSMCGYLFLFSITPTRTEFISALFSIISILNTSGSCSLLFAHFIYASILLYTHKILLSLRSMPTNPVFLATSQRRFFT